MVHTRDRIIVATNELFTSPRVQRHDTHPDLRGVRCHDRLDLPLLPRGKEALAVAVVDTHGCGVPELFESIVAEADDPAAAYVDFFTGAAAVLEESDFIDPCPIGTIAREVANTSEPAPRSGPARL